MKRRKFVRYVGLSALGATLAGVSSLARPGQAQSTGSVTIEWLGHTCFLFSGDGRRILTNPFQTIGCTSGYRPPNVVANVVMISSRLLDEGVVEGLPGDPRILSEPGVYEFSNMQVQGIATDHDRNQGQRFGTNVVWRWTQGGLNILHMGGAAAPITVEQQILMGRPDVMLVPVGGGVKAYTAAEAKDAVEMLRPKIVIPTHYRTAAADPDACDISEIDDFLALMGDTLVNRRGSASMTLSRSDLPAEGMKIEVLTYQF